MSDLSDKRETHPASIPDTQVYAVHPGAADSKHIQLILAPLLPFFFFTLTQVFQSQVSWKLWPGWLESREAFSSTSLALPKSHKSRYSYLTSECGRYRPGFLAYGFETQLLDGYIKIRWEEIVRVFNFISPFFPYCNILTHNVYGLKMCVGCSEASALFAANRLCASQADFVSRRL